MAYDSSNKLKRGMGGQGRGRWGRRAEVKVQLARKRREESKALAQDGLKEYYEEIVDSWVPVGADAEKDSAVIS